MHHVIVYADGAALERFALLNECDDLVIAELAKRMPKGSSMTAYVAPHLLQQCSIAVQPVTS